LVVGMSQQKRLQREETALSQRLLIAGQDDYWQQSVHEILTEEFSF
jgi:hypothetical protein